MDTISQSLRAHMNRDGRSPNTLAEDMWGPWDDLSDEDRRRARRAGGKRIRHCLDAGWIADQALAEAWAAAYGVTVQELMFGGADRLADREIIDHLDAIADSGTRHGREVCDVIHGRIVTYDPDADRFKIAQTGGRWVRLEEALDSLR